MPASFFGLRSILLLYDSDSESPVAGLFAGGRVGVRVAAGVGDGRTGGVGVGVVAGTVCVFVFAAG